jgi:hypothetical protein
VSANPFQHFEAGFARELEVEQNQLRWQRTLAIRERAGSAEVVNGFFAVAYVMDGVHDSRCAESALQEENVLFIVFYM